MHTQQFRVRETNGLSGNSFYEAFLMGMNRSGGKVSDGEVDGMRRYVGDYIARNKDQLAQHPLFAEANLDLIHRRVLTDGRWSGNNADHLVPILAAQSIGREVHILQQGQGKHYDTLDDIPARSAGLPESSSKHGGGDPIFLLKKGDRFDLLEPKTPVDRSTDSLDDTSYTSSTYAGSTYTNSSVSSTRPLRGADIPATQPAGMRVVEADITTLEVDAIVNAANMHLQRGGGVCGDIFKAAEENGSDQKLRDACSTLKACRPGRAKVTSGQFGSLKCDHIIHAVGPDCSKSAQRNNREELLAMAYQSAVEEADKKGCKSIAFPAISVGTFGSNPAWTQAEKDAWTEQAITIATDTVNKSLKNCMNLKEVIFACVDDPLAKIYQKSLGGANDSLASSVEDFYSSYIQNNLGGGGTLANATPEQIQGLLSRLRNDFLKYNDVVTKYKAGDNGKYKAGDDDEKNKTHKEIKHEIENVIGNNIAVNRIGKSYRKGHREVLKALNLINGRIGQVLSRRIAQETLNNPDTDHVRLLTHCKGLSTKLGDTLRKPTFDIDRAIFNADVAALPPINTSARPKVRFDEGQPDTQYVGTSVAHRKARKNPDWKIHKHSHAQVVKDAEALRAQSGPQIPLENYFDSFGNPRVPSPDRDTESGSTLGRLMDYFWSGETETQGDTQANIDGVKFPTLPTAEFNRRGVGQNGDSFYRGLAIGLGGKGTDREIFSLKQHFANFLNEHVGALEDDARFKPFIGTLYNLLSESTGAYANSAIEKKATELLPLLAAQTLGREVCFLQRSADDDTNYDVLPVAYDVQLSGRQPNKKLDPIYLLKLGDGSETDPIHYELLERIPDSTAISTESQIKQKAEKDPLDPYSSYIDLGLSRGRVGGGAIGLNGASAEQIQNLLGQLNKDFATYEDLMDQLNEQNGRREQFKEPDKIYDLKQQMNQLVGYVGSKRREGPKGFLKAFEVINSKVAEEVDKRLNDPLHASLKDELLLLNMCLSATTQLRSALDRVEHSFKPIPPEGASNQDAKSIHGISGQPLADLEQLTPEELALKSKLDASTDYDNFIAKDLLGPTVFFHNASAHELEGALAKLEGIYRKYLNATNEYDKHKGKKGKADIEIKTKSKHIKDGLENLVKKLGPIRHIGRLNMLLAMNEIHAKLTLELKTLDHSRQVDPKGKGKTEPLSDQEKLAFARDLKSPPMKLNSKQLTQELSKAGYGNVAGVDVPAKNLYLSLSEQYPNLVNGDTIKGIHSQQYRSDEKYVSEEEARRMEHESQDTVTVKLWSSTNKEHGVEIKQGEEKTSVKLKDNTPAPPLDKANPEQLNDAFKRLNEIFSEYQQHIQTIQEQEAKYKQKRNSKELTKAHHGAQKLEDIVGINAIKPALRSRRENPIDMLKAMTIMRGRMDMELQRLKADSDHQDSAAIAQCEDELKRLTRTIQQPGFEFDHHKLESRLGKVGLTPIASEVTSPEDPLVRLTEGYRDFETGELLPPGATVENANREQLSAALNRFNEIYSEYSKVMARIESEEAKPTPPRFSRFRIYDEDQYRDNDKIDRLKDRKRDIEDSVGDNTFKKLGMTHREGRQGFLKAMNLVHERLNRALAALPEPAPVPVSEPSPQPDILSRFLGAPPAQPAPEPEMPVSTINFDQAQLNDDLKRPNFDHNVRQLKADIKLPETSKELMRKQAVMDAYVDDTLHTLELLTQPGNKTAVKKLWQSASVDNRVNALRKELIKLKKDLPEHPSDASIVNFGVEANKQFKRCYRDIAKIAERKIYFTSNNPANARKRKALEDLRDTAHLAEQHHRSSQHLGLITSVNVAFEENLPRHILERLATAPAPGVSVSSDYSLALGGTFGFGGLADIPELRVTAQGKIGNESAMSVVRTNEANLFGENTYEPHAELRFAANAGTTKSPEKFDDELGEVSLPKGAGASANLSGKHRRGAATLAVTPASMLGGVHAQTLKQGKSIGGSVGFLSNWSGIEDVFGNKTMAGVSYPSIKQGYYNNEDLAEGFQRLLGDEAKGVVYDRKGKVPLGKLFTSTALNCRDEASIGQDKNPEATMFPDTLWESREYIRTTTGINASAEVSIGFKQVDEEMQGAFFNEHEAGHALEALYTLLGLRAGVSGSFQYAHLKRTVRSPKLPHDIFDPTLNKSPRCCANYAENYFSTPSPAMRVYTKSLADDLGFNNVDEYFAAMASSFGDDGPNDKLSQVTDQQRKNLTNNYLKFQDAVKAIDQFYLQPVASLKQRKIDQASNAIQYINNTYGTNLPVPDESNLATFAATKNNRKGGGGYTDSYRDFQDAAVAILGSYSAAGGAIKLMSTRHAKDNVQEAELGKTAASLLTPIKRVAMPWSKNEIADRGTYVRQQQSYPYSDSFQRTRTKFLELQHTAKSGDYQFQELGTDDTLASLLAQKSPGLGPRITRSFTRAHLPDAVSFPAQTGIQRFTVDSWRKMKLPLRELLKQETKIGAIKEMIRNVFSYTLEQDYGQERKKTQAYPLNPGKYYEGDREFLAYRAQTDRQQTSKSVRVGAQIDIGASPVHHFSRREEINRYELGTYTYGNDAGAMAVIMAKLFADNKIKLNDFNKVVEASQSDNELENGEPLTFLDNLDPRVSHAFLGDKHYDHMSSVLSKFRNSAFELVDSEDGRKKELKIPTFSDNGDGKIDPDSVSEELRTTLRDSKGNEVDLNNQAKDYIRRSSFFGYAVARYDQELIQDSFKNWDETCGVTFPDVTEIDNLLAKQVIDKDGNTMSRQKWLKKASEEDRKKFYQTERDGKELLLNYLKVTSFSSVLNDVIFHNNTYKMVTDEKQVKRVDTLFGC